ncbi:MAG: hypothetical protein U1C51_03730 [Candidatus Izemoplasmatales bacterium]|nr:hypothetical protein [Candidatus Izemoplasmatales bacterium]
MNKQEATVISNEQYLNTLKNAKFICDLNTIGTEKKGFIKHAIQWAIEKHIKQEQTEKELELYKEVVMEFLTSDGQSGNDQVLKAIKAYRKLRSMMGLEGDNHGNETQTSLFDDNQ